jgi:glycosyltransferase involved in cell wall biosynthesis
MSIVSSTNQLGLTVGIDAANISAGGGVTHLIELLAAAKPRESGVDRVVIWSGNKTLSILDSRPWLEKINPPDLNRGIINRTLWQSFQLSKSARQLGCDVLLVPGGSYRGNFHPIVAMSQNLLPFEQLELRRYGWSGTGIKLSLLRQTQSHTFINADGVIFLTDYAKECVTQTTGFLPGTTTTIPHGLNPRFYRSPKPQLPIEEYSPNKPYHILYVSIIEFYKHQWHVVKAIHRLRQAGLPLVLDLVGPAYQPALDWLNQTIHQYDPQHQWVTYHGPVSYFHLDEIYAQADLGIFAFSCENMPNILLENMAAGLPIACSNRGPMPEVLEDAGVYFDPESVDEIVNSLEKLIHNPSLRQELAHHAYSQSQCFSWEQCAEKTFSFLAETAHAYKKAKWKK